MRKLPYTKGVPKSREFTERYDSLQKTPHRCTKKTLKQETISQMYKSSSFASIALLFLSCTAITD